MTFISKFTVILLSILLLFSACKKDDPILEDENEFIHLVKIEFKDSLGQNTYTWKDKIGGDTIYLKPEQKYSVAVSFYTLSVNQVDIDITDEIIADNLSHQVFYSSDPSSLLSIAYEDKDDKGLPLGIKTSMTTSNTLNQGTLRVLLKHYSAEKDGNSASGSTDADVSFVVKID